MCGINQRESALMVDRVEMVRSLSDMEKLVNHSPKSIMIGSGFGTVQTRPNQSRTVRSMPEPRTVLWSGSGCYLDRGPNHRGTGPKVRFEPWFRTGPRQHYYEMTITVERVVESRYSPLISITDSPPLVTANFPKEEPWSQVFVNTSHYLNVSIPTLTLSGDSPGNHKLMLSSKCGAWRSPNLPFNNYYFSHTDMKADSSMQLSQAAAGARQSQVCMQGWPTHFETEGSLSTIYFHITGCHFSLPSDF
jgi:hypothetical protein